MNAKILGQIFLASAVIGAGVETGRILALIAPSVFSKKFREDVKAEMKMREAKRRAKLTVVS